MFRKIINVLLLCVIVFGISTSKVSAENENDFKISIKAVEANDSQVVVTLLGENLQDLYAYEVKLKFDSTKLKVVKGEVSLKGFLVSPIVDGNNLTMAFTKIGKTAGEKGKVELGKIIFESKKVGTSELNWNSIILLDSDLTKQELKLNQNLVYTKYFDDIVKHWAKDDIMLMVDAGVVQGMTDKLYGPQQNITRAQFAALLSRALKLNESGTNPFKDVKAGVWYEGVVSGAYNAGLIQGVSEDSFAPDQPITREQMATMIARAVAHMKGTTFENLQEANNQFVDRQKISTWAAKGVGIAVKENLMNGKTNNQFVPNEKTTRAEAAVVIKRLLQN